jgi:hypothetical protein
LLLFFSLSFSLSVQTQKINLEAILAWSKMLKETLGKEIPIFHTLGNHEGANSGAARHAFKILAPDAFVLCGCSLTLILRVRSFSLTVSFSD